MGRLLAIDYGTKRTGIAVSDPLKLIASPLASIETHRLIPFLQQYCKEETVEAFVLGKPIGLDGQDAPLLAAVVQIARQLAVIFPDKKIHWIDERFTSRIAEQAVARSGLNQKSRRNKSMVDRIAATVILQDFMERAAKFPNSD